MNHRCIRKARLVVTLRLLHLGLRIFRNQWMVAIVDLVGAGYLGHQASALRIGLTMLFFVILQSCGAFFVVLAQRSLVPTAPYQAGHPSPEETTDGEPPTGG